MAYQYVDSIMSALIDRCLIFCFCFFSLIFEAAWYVISLVSVCLLDNNFRKPWGRKFIYAYPVYLQWIQFKFLYEGHLVEVKLTGAKKDRKFLFPQCKTFWVFITPVLLHYVTLETIYSGLSKSNLKDRYGDAATEQRPGMIAEINVFSLSDEMWVMGQTGRRQVDCSRVVVQQQQKSDRRQWHAVTGGRREDWRSTSPAGLDVSLADQRRAAAGATNTEVQCREKLGRQWPSVWTWCARVLADIENWREHL